MSYELFQCYLMALQSWEYFFPIFLPIFLFNYPPTLDNKLWVYCCILRIKYTIFRTTEVTNFCTNFHTPGFKIFPAKVMRMNRYINRWSRETTSDNSQRYEGIWNDNKSHKFNQRMRVRQCLTVAFW